MTEEDDEYDIEIKERKRLTEETKQSQEDEVEESEMQEKCLDQSETTKQLHR